jgi:elongation factor Ts
MSAISASAIQSLREETGAGVMECKKALEEAQGDVPKAKELLKERGLAKVEKRSGRETGAGMIASYVHGGRIGALVDVRAETDFVVRSEPFQALAKELAMQLAAVPAETVDDFLSQPSMRDGSKTVKDLVNDVIARVGENVMVHAVTRLEI